MFVAKIVVLNNLGKIRAGYTPVVHYHTSHVSCKIQKLISKIDQKTGKIIDENPQSIVSGEVAIVEMVPRKPMVIETFAEYPRLGSFVIRDMNKTIGVGIVISVKKKIV